VAHLLSYWPDVTVLSSPKRVSGNESRRIAGAKRSNVGWVRKVLEPTWLPEDKSYLGDNLIMIRNEFNEVDVTHAQWAKNGYNIEVSQTRSIIAIKFTPLQSKNMGETVGQKIEFTKALAHQILNKTGMRYGSQDSIDEKGTAVKKHVKVPVRNLHEKICSYSFRRELVSTFPDGIIGTAATMEDEGIPWTNQTGEAINAENREDNPNWDKTRSSWSYWFRHVCWVHDGKSIGFFTLKREADAIAIDYWGKLDTIAFEGAETAN